MSDCLSEIDLSDIDLTDHRYKISASEKDITFLSRSIKETGLICPPTLRPLKNKFIVVSGFNRIRALHQNNMAKIVAYTIPKEASDYDCLVAAITALAFQRPLTSSELIKSTTRLHQFLTKDEIAKNSAIIFNTELNTRFIGDLLAIGALPDPALELIHTNKLSLKSARRISSYGTDGIIVFLSLFSEINASNNKQLEIILHLTEIAARDAVGLKDVFNDRLLQEILADENKEPGVKTSLLRAFLFERRFPTLSKARHLVREKIRSIKLGKKVQLLPPENFESQTYSISFTAKNHSEFVEKVHSLNSAAANAKLKEILNQ